ncbi:MAG: hypothetical protein JNL28_14025 [Planctomycetes bacterium]|nr:hypothetical protein [Planctomycetota bacterium]
MNIHHKSLGLRAQPILLSALALSAFALDASAQAVFSIDYRGASIGTPATGGGCITAADLLMTPPAGVPGYGPLLPPMIFVSGGLGPPGPGLGIGFGGGAVCICPVPGMIPCARELDALSFGFDAPVKPQQMPAGVFVFSVDACTMGAPGPLAPNVASEAPVGDSAADVFESLFLPAAPVGPFLLFPLTGNSGIIDGNGLVSGSGALYPGLGLIEPRLPGPALTGDDVDALDLRGPAGAVPFPVYFSLDAAFPNACSGFPNTGSAAANGVPPGAVLVTLAPGGPPIIYAPPGILGLDLFGPGTDDLDALALTENGVAGFQVSPAPYAWAAAAPTDMLLFSVRRGSAVIGMPDSIFGAPIEPGDILVPPVAGGLSPFPGIFVAAEALGLATGRAGFAMAAEMDALDTVQPPQTGLPYCFGTAAACPCGNAGAPGNGCAHSANPLGANIAAAGIASVSADTVVLTGSGMPAGGPCLYFQGTAQAALPFGDGVLCIGGAIVRLGVKFNNLAGSSTIPSGLDPALSVMGLVPPAGGFRFYSSWYRDAALFCTPATFNVTNGVGVLWTP